MEQIKLTIVPTGKRDSFDDPIYEATIDDGGLPAWAEGSRIQLNTTLASNLKAMLARLDTMQDSELTITFTLQERQEQ